MSADRARSVDREGRLVRHQQSLDSGRIHVPMWDSSDPDRAPPPLPLNPNPAAPATRPNASAHIQAAAEALSAKARESLTPSPYMSNPMPERSNERSPDRSLIKGAAHRRLQSLQTPSVKDLRSYLDGNRSPERSPERPRAGTIAPTPKKELDGDLFSSPNRAGTPTPTSRESKDIPERRASSRPPPKAILGENTPPSATMLALQTYPARDFSENNQPNTNNGSSPRKMLDGDFGLLSTQITSLTSICTKMQAEMDKLSRRSKDNATDLISLKEATNARDEDIRKSLRELTNTLNSTNFSASTSSNIFGQSVRGSSSTFGSSTPPPSNKFTLPRIPSPNSLFDDRVGSPTPNLYTVDGVASVAMLEKIIREMVTKENQENLLSTLSQLFDSASKDSAENSKKLEEMFKEMKAIAAAAKGETSRALVPASLNGIADSADNSASTAGPLARTTRDVQTVPSPGGNGEQKPYTSPKAADFVSDEMIKLLKKIKESVTQSGGLLGEVKAQQRDLRGEVLHMGREIARKIDESRKPATGAKAIEDGSGKQDIARIVQEGLADLKVYLDEAMREKRRQSSGTTISKSSVNSQEVYDIVRHTMSQHGLDRMTSESESTATALAPGLDKDAILNAIKEAYEEYKPDVQIEQYGLERHEILECLREGLEQHQSPEGSQSLSRAEIMEAIQDAMKNFQPPPPINEASELRDEILNAVRECLDEFKPSLAVAKPASVNSQDQDRLLDMMRQVVLDAVKAGLLQSGGVGGSRELEISQEDLYAAVSNALNSSGSPFGRYGEQVVAQLQEVVQNMHAEFKEYSTANGRDTEQVLDAMKDGLESLRGEIELYVDRAQDVTQKDDIIEAIRDGLDRLGRDVQAWCAAGPTGDNSISRTEMLEYIKSEFELLHQEISDRERTSVIPSPGDNAAVLGAIHDGFEMLKENLRSVEFSELSRGQVDEEMRNELEQLRDTILGGSSIHKDEIIDTIRAHFDTMHGKIDGGAFSGTSEEMLRELKEELEHLRETIATSLARPTCDLDNGAIREMLQEMREQVVSENGAASREMLSTMQSEIEQLRETLSGALVAEGSNVNKDEIMEALRTTMSSVQNLADRQPSQIDEELLGAIRGEFEILRSNVANGFSRGLQTADREDILEAMRLGFDDLRSDLIKKIENPEQHMKATGELLDALNEGLEGLKSEVRGGSNAEDKPIDMTVSYEILDTLKDGIASLRADMAKLKLQNLDEEESDEPPESSDNAIVLAESDVGAPVSREVSSPAKSRKRKDLEKLEVMLAQLQVKVDAMDANITESTFQPPATAPAEGTAMKTDLESIENLIKELQATVDVLAAREDVDISGLPKKEDVEAIETLLSNTKAKLDDIQMPDLSATASKEQLEAVETLIKSTREAIDELNVRVEDNIAKKEQVATVESLIQDLKSAIDDMKLSKSEDNGDNKIEKSDIDAIGLIALDIKEKLGSMKEMDDLPSKADIESLTALVHDFRDSHEKLKETYESDVALTAKAFDDRRNENEDIITAIGVVKSFLSDVKEELKSKLDVSALETTTLADNFKIMEKTIENNFNVMGDVKELMEIVNREFERIHGTFDDVKVQQEQKSTEEKEKHDATKEAVISEVSAKLDEKFDAIMSKYDDAQHAAEAQVKSMEERAAEQQVLLQTTKEVSEELKLSVDTLGTTLTAIDAHFSEIGDKVSSDSQTVFTKLETVTEGFQNLETRTAAKEDHELTRAEVAKALDAIGGMAEQNTEFQPKILVSVQELHALVEKHYELSQKAQEAAQQQAETANEQSKSLAEEIKTSFSSLPALLPPPQPAIEAASNDVYDDAQVQEKLNQVLESLNTAKDSWGQLERLDQIHQQVMATAAEVSAFVSTQTRLIDEGHESKQKEAEEMALLLERRTAEKEHLESTIEDLKDEKESLLALIESLQSERDSLAIQKSRLAADVAAMQTALSIRQEELDAMDAKAEALERRVLEGIMNQSRLLMMAKGTSKPGTGEARIASNASHSTIGQLSSLSAAGKGLSMALQKRPVAGRRNAASNNPTARRVMSLNPISHNTPTGAQGYLAATRNVENSVLKRSQSVRTNKYRKVSWNSAPDKQHTSSIHEMAEDKENNVISEANSEDEQLDDNDDSDTVSDSGTERRSSHIAETEGQPTSSYAGSVSEDSERPTSRGTMTGTEFSGSYVTESEVSNRRTSYASTLRSTLGADTVIDEEDEESDSEREHDLDEDRVSASEESEAEMEHEHSDHVTRKEMVVYAAPSDSGLGTDLPTAMMSGSETDYFRRKAEED
ncbi:uncharacterized protein PV09_03410 [Verruconis gallopava]|uniref:Chromosome segregation ATPase family protein n=1 Tax=Verruconis gallopava TaxID=253628 RepID=A0A0D2AG95_9PEZI|nr:uncharacterized protein PV09_03410 [Verruconis gallopava]KIW05530.1 hypothetical protein PV09_03410 [Verruconis gallopava]